MHWARQCKTPWQFSQCYLRGFICLLVECGMVLHVKTSHHVLTSAPVLPSEDATDAQKHPGCIPKHTWLLGASKMECFSVHIYAKELSLSGKVKFVTRKANSTIACLNKLGSRIFSPMLFLQQANVSIILFSEITIYYPCRRPKIQSAQCSECHLRYKDLSSVFIRIITLHMSSGFNNKSIYYLNNYLWQEVYHWHHE